MKLLLLIFLVNRNAEHRYMLKQRYTQLFNKDLVKELKSLLGSKLEDVVIALLQFPYELDCTCLY